MRTIQFREAVAEAMSEEMRLDDSIYLMGEEVAEYNGAYKASKGEIDLEKIDEILFSKLLYTRDIPDPDLLIRTGGEFRLSNFLLWQIAYTEIHVTETFWPSFGNKELTKAIYDYQTRERRFGKISEQLKFNNV